MGWTGPERSSVWPKSSELFCTMRNKVQSAVGGLRPTYRMITHVGSSAAAAAATATSGTGKKSVEQTKMLAKCTFEAETTLKRMVTVNTRWCVSLSRALLRHKPFCSQCRGPAWPDSWTQYRGRHIPTPRSFTPSHSANE